MPRFMHPHFEMMLFEVERLLRRAKDAKGPGLVEVKHQLHRLIRDLIHVPFLERSFGPMEHESMMLLEERIERASSRQELQDVVRDIKWYALALSTASQSYEMEERFHSLEEEVRKAAQSATVLSEPAEPEKVVTVESLKRKDVLFAIMPYSDEFYDVWVGGIKRAASGTGFIPVRIDMITKSADITDDIVSVIRDSKVIVVDVTKNNPNVMFELGYALALTKAHVIISQSTEYLPFDIQNIRTVIYRNTWRGIEELHTALQKFIKGAHGEKSKKSDKG